MIAIKALMFMYWKCLQACTFEKICGEHMQTGRLSDRQAGRRAGRQAGRQAGRLSGGLSDTFLLPLV